MFPELCWTINHEPLSGLKINSSGKKRLRAFHFYNSPRQHFQSKPPESKYVDYLYPQSDSSMNLNQCQKWSHKCATRFVCIHKGSGVYYKFYESAPQDSQMHNFFCSNVHISVCTSRNILCCQLHMHKSPIVGESVNTSASACMWMWLLSISYSSRVTKVMLRSRLIKHWDIWVVPNLLLLGKDSFLMTQWLITPILKHTCITLMALDSKNAN